MNLDLRVLQLHLFSLKEMVSRVELSGFTSDQLYDFLQKKVNGEVSSESLESLRKNRINGKVFLDLSAEDLKEVISLLGERKLILSIIQSYNQQTKKVRLVNLGAVLDCIPYT